MLNRREFMATCASLAALPFPPGAIAAAKAQEKSVTYQVNFDELAKAFPGSGGASALPPLLHHFGEWMRGKPWQSIGAFDLSPEWSDARFPAGELFYDKFALFIRLPTGSAVGYWLAGNDLSDAPIVLLGSEGEYQTLAPNLETLLARIALGDFTGEGAAADFNHSDEDYGEGVAPDLRDDLQALLRQQTGVRDLAALVRKAKPAPMNFTDWIAKTSEARYAHMRAHPAMLAINAILEKYRPVNGQSWEGSAFDVTWAGPHFDIWAKPAGQATLPEAEQLKPHLAVLREEAAMQTPGLGLWHHAILTAYKDQADIVADYLFEPPFHLANPPADAFKSDQAKSPVAPRRIPPWLATILNA
jgi:hypothetical protein